MKRYYFFPASLRRTGSRYLLQNRWFSILMVIGIAIGVAVVVAIDIANSNAMLSFELSKQAVIGRASHQIVGGPEGLDEAVYILLRRQNVVEKAAPIIDTIVTSERLGDLPLNLLGIDVFADRDFRSYFDSSGEIPIEQLVEFLATPGALLVSEDTAERFGLKIGDTLEIDIAGIKNDAFVAGLIEPLDTLSSRTLEGVLLADIATAQELTGNIGKIDRIDLILSEEALEASLDQLRALLPSGAQVVDATSRSSSIDEMTSAFRTNLTALSLLALLVGLFLIYNTITYSVVKRRSLFGLLRCIGVTRREIIFLVITESFIVGLIGSILGVLLGLLMGQQTTAMVSQTINDLYFTTTVQTIPLNLNSLIKGGLIGILATVITAVFPALEASFIPPRIAMSRSGLESKAHGLVLWLSLAGVGLILVGLLVFMIPSRNILLGFAGTLLVVLGLAMESALFLESLVKLLRPAAGSILGFLGKMAPASLVNNLSRTSIAVAALMVAIAVVIGMNLMIDSFRSTVTIWLEQTLMGDIYISAPSFTSTNPTESISPDVISTLEQWPQIDRIDTLRTVRIEAAQGPITLNATENPDFGSERQYARLDISEAEVWQQMNEGGILITEALAYRFNLDSADHILSLKTEKGWQDFPIIGVIYEYTSSEGSIWMAYDVYEAYWQDEGITALALRLAEGTNVDEIARSIQDSFRSLQRLTVRPNSVLKSEVLNIFDRTFAITDAMRLMATAVAFVGVLTTAILLQLEKKREMGILRALGLTGRQLWVLVFLESGLIGLVSGLLALPTGSILATILVEVINRRSFGWTIQLQIPPESLLQGLLIAVGASLLAGIYPAWTLSKMVTAEAIRYE